MIFNTRGRKETGSHDDESFVRGWKSYYSLSVSLVLVLLNIDEIYGPLRSQKLQQVGHAYTCPHACPHANSDYQNMAEGQRSHLYIWKRLNPAWFRGNPGLSPG